MPCRCWNERAVLQPPLALTGRELAYMPGSVRYIVQSEDLYQTYYHTPVKQCAPVAGTAGVVSDPSCEPLNILGDFHDSVPEFPSPNVKGVRFKYIDALAKTLQELDPIIKAGLGELNLDPGTTVLKTTVKDGDGMGDVSVYKETGDRFLPDKAFHHSFAVIKIEVVCNGSKTELFVEETPNSVRTNRPLLNNRRQTTDTLWRLTSAGAMSMLE